MSQDPLKPEFWKEYARKGKEPADSRFLSPDFWDRLSESYDELEEDPFYQQMVEEVISAMRQRGALSPEARVFDVCCGPGNYAVRFAPHVKEVVGLDVSPKMLALFEERMKEAGFNNYRLIKADWFSYEPEERFDTVFVSMSPILHDLDSVDRLLGLAERFLVLVHWAGVRENLLQQRLVREVLGMEMRWKKAGIIVPFNYLYTLGYPGDLRFFCGYWRRKRPVEKELEHLLWRLEGQGVEVSSAQREKFLALLQKEADPYGNVVSQTRVRIGMVMVEVGGPCARQGPPETSSKP
ncbi:MAG: class I SAM-dependent methyltransferase [Thermodesulfobacteria bacterium]|nr:class I SAM-dependent methyltransferase [Thermodesulfobacteriota bacterium]